MDPRCRKCRRAGEKLFLRGSRCLSPKCPFTKRNYPPGVHGQKGRGRRSEYGTQLCEKQKIKAIYGLNEAQLRNYFLKAVSKKGVTSEILLELLERRLDNVVFRLGFAPSRRAARQLVSHGLILVNGRRVDIPSYGVKKGDKIAVKESKKKKTYFKKLIEEIKDYKAPKWLELDIKNLTGKVVAYPAKQDFDVSADIQLIIEFYSR